MKFRNRILLTTSLVCHLTPTVAYAEPAVSLQEPHSPAAERPFALMVGDKAPAPQIEKWVAGKPVARWEEGKIYVIDLWATWCGPCLAGIPHLSALQKRYRGQGVQIIGLTSPDDYGNTLAAVEKRAKAKDRRIAYTIAWDSPSTEAYLGVFKGKTTAALMKAAGITGLPVCFVVDKQGRIAYIGHPAGLDETLQALVKGHWNTEREATKYRAKREAETLLVTYQECLKAKRYDDAYALARQLLNSVLNDDPRSMLILVDAIVNPSGNVEKKDLDIALQAATRAAALTHYRDPGMMDELARVYFARGDRHKAIELVSKAIRLAEGGQKDALEKVRQQYLEAKPEPGS